MPRVEAVWSRVRQSSGTLPFLAGSFASVVLLSTRSVEQLRDSLVYADSIQRSEQLFHPHHLIFGFVIAAVRMTVMSVGVAIDAIEAAQIHNVFWSAVAIACAFAALRAVRTPFWISTLAVLGIVFSRGFWELSTQSTVYAAALGTAMLVIWRLAGHEEKLTWRLIASTGVLWALACLYHQVNVLLGIPILAVLVYLHAKEGVIGWLWTSVVAGAITLAIYAAIYLAEAPDTSIQGFVGYCLSYTDSVCWGTNCVPAPDNWGTHHNFAMQGLVAAASSLAWNVIVLPKSLSSIVGLAVAGGCLLAVFLGFRHSRQKTPAGALIVMAIATMLTYTAFSTWWLPDYEHPFVIPTTCMTLVVAVLAGSVMNRRFTGGTPPWILLTAALALLILGGRNLQARILPLLENRGDSYADAASVAELAGEECEAVASYRVWANLRYYFDLGDRARLVKAALLSSYRSGTLEPERTSTCKVIAIRFLSPRYQILGYGPSPIDGYSDPDGWRDFIAGIVGVQRDGDGRPISRQPFWSIRAGEHDYLVVGAGAQPASSIDQVLVDLTRAVKDNSPEISRDIERIVAGSGKHEGAITPLHSNVVRANGGAE